MDVPGQAKGLPPVRMAVNLSAQQFYRGNIVQVVREALEGAGLDPQWLELELTESLTLDDSEATVRIMADLKHSDGDGRLFSTHSSRNRLSRRHLER